MLYYSDGKMIIKVRENGQVVIQKNFRTYVFANEEEACKELRIKYLLDVVDYFKDPAAFRIKQFTRRLFGFG